MTGMGTTVREINRLKIKARIDGSFGVYTPDGRTCLEEFVSKRVAEDWARKTTDYVPKARAAAR